ncbi:MAG: MFS transporter [Actinomycetota bacterium]
MSLGHRYHRLFAASTISNLGDGIFLIALPLVAADLTRDPTEIAAVTFALRLPWLLFALVAGALVDRWDRRRVMWIADVIRAGLVAALALAVMTDQHSILMLYVVGFALGVAETFFDNASQTIMPSLIDDPELLPKANGRLFSAETITNNFVGPPLGGLLVAVAASVPFWIDAASFLAASALIASIPGSFRAARSDGGAERRSLRAEIAEGVRWLSGHRLLRTLAVLLGLMNMWFTAAFSILVLFAQDILDLGDVGFGILGTSMAFGSVLAGMVTSRLDQRFGPGPLLLTGAFGIALSQLVVGPLSDPWLVGLVLAASGFFAVMWNVVTVSLRQTIIPDELLGRVNSVYRFLGWGGMPIGALIGGVLADAYGLRAPFYVGGAFLVVASIIAAPVLTTREVESAKAAAAEAASADVSRSP